MEIPALGEDEAYLEDTGAWRIVQKDAGSKPVSLLCSGGGVFISEAIPDNGSYRVGDVPGFPDIIEICNGTDDTIDLSDYALSDTLSHPTLFSFESGCSLEPGAYALVACTKEAYLDTSLSSCAAFSLDSEGESLYLYRKSTQQIVDAVDIPALDVDCSYAREGDTWSVQQSPTPGYPNTALGIALTDAGLRSGNSSGIYISEVCSSNLSIALPNTEESSDFIARLVTVREIVKHDYNGKISHKDIEDLNKGHKQYKHQARLAKTNFVNVVVDAFYVQKFSIDFTEADEDGEAIVTLYRTDVKTEDVGLEYQNKRTPKREERPWPFLWCSRYSITRFLGHNSMMQMRPRMPTSRSLIQGTPFKPSDVSDKFVSL